MENVSVELLLRENIDGDTVGQETNQDEKDLEDYNYMKFSRDMKKT